MSNFGILKETVLGCVSRAQPSFQTGAQNFVHIAINNAVIHAQRAHDFQWLKGDVSIECSPKGSINAALDSNDDPVKLKRIIKAFANIEPLGHVDIAVPYLSRQSQIADLTRAEKFGCTPYQGAKVVHDGQTVYMSPAPVSSPYTLYFHAIRWLPRLTIDADTNFLFDYGFDWLMYRSIIELNFHIKEDERFQVSAAMLKEAWDSLVGWDTTLVSPTETEIEL